MSLPAETYDMPSSKRLHDDECMTSQSMPLNIALLQCCRHTYSAARLFPCSLNIFSFEHSRRFFETWVARHRSQGISPSPWCTGCPLIRGTYWEPQVQSIQHIQLRPRPRVNELQVNVLHLRLELTWDPDEYFMREPKHDKGSAITWSLLSSPLNEVGRLGLWQPKHVTVMADDNGDRYFDNTCSDTRRWTVGEKRIVAEAVKQHILESIPKDTDVEEASEASEP